MFTHVMIGSNDLERARRFYDATFAALGGKPGEIDARGRLIYAHDGGRLMVTKPIDGKPATVANGGTIGIAAASRDHVLVWHEAGMAHGGTAIESPPMERPDGSFVAYLRDPDGNKLTARTHPTRCRRLPQPRRWHQSGRLGRTLSISGSALHPERDGLTEGLQILTLTESALADFAALANVRKKASRQWQLMARPGRKQLVRFQNRSWKTIPSKAKLIGLARCNHARATEP